MQQPVMLPRPIPTGTGILVFLLLLFLSFSEIQAQQTVPLLERKVNITAHNQSIETVLTEISRQSGVVFSYNTQVIPADEKVSLSLQDKSVRFALNSLFSGDIGYKVKGKYVILKGEEGKQKAIAEQTLEGYIYESGTGNKLSGASVYNNDLTASAVTDQYGYFRMEIPDNTPLASIQVSKIGYSDTTIFAMEAPSLRTLEMKLHTDKTGNKNAFIDFHKLAPAWLVPKQTLANSLNIEKSVFRAVQLSLVPSLSTNRFVGGNVVNEVSINLLAGYVQGVRLAEIGGLLNIVKEDAQYVQVGGIGNMVGNQVRGAQMAGVFNTARDVQGVQLSGVFNTSRAHAGFQVSGIYNQTQTGLSQTSGVANTARTMKLQISGVFNNASDSADVQIAGLLNRARYVGALQLAVINIADSSKGIPIGLFNFVKKGYHKLEFSTDEAFPFNISFRSGVKQFHSIVIAGTNPFEKTGSTFHFGYGFGSSFGKTSKLLFDVDLVYREVFSKSDLSFNNHLFQVYAGIDKPLSSTFSLAAGLTYNYLSYNIPVETNAISVTMPPYELSSHAFSNGNAGKSWIGGRIAIRYR